MEENKFIEELQKRILQIDFYRQEEILFKELKESLRTASIIDYYFTKTKDDNSTHGDKIVSLFFDENLIHWLFIDAISIYQKTYPINKIKSVSLFEKNDNNSLGYPSSGTIDELSLILTFSVSDIDTITLNSATREFNKLLQFKNTLLKQFK